MPATTPEYELPYPLGTEAANGPGAIGALATALEALFTARDNPSFTGVTFNGAWTDFGSGLEETSYALVGGRVFLRGTFKHGTTSTTGTVFTLPAGFRPAKSRGYLVPANVGSAIISINSSGVVSVAAYAASGNGASVAIDGISFDTAA